MDEWVLWMIAAGVLAVGEMFTLGFFAGPIAVAAVMAAIVALAGGGVALQWIVFTAMSAASLLVLRPIARRHLRTPAQLRTGTAALVGASAVVIDRVDRDGGTVQARGRGLERPLVRRGPCLRARHPGRGAQDRRRHGAGTRIAKGPTWPP